MPVAGPCANPDCFTPDQASQWQYVPEAFAGARRPDTTCVCKKAGCLRWCGLRGPKQVPGRKRATGEAGLAAGAAAHRAPDELHCPPIIRSIDEIWAVRCAALPRTCAFFTFSHLFSRLLLSSVLSLALRFADIDALDEVTRANKLPYDASSSLEYAVHGKYARSPDDSNGLFGTWYIGLSELVQTFGKEVVATKVAEFEAAATAAREEALGAIELEGEEETAPPT